MSNLIPRPTDLPDSRPPSPRSARDLARLVREEQARALVRAARVDGNAHVTRTALMNTAMLSQDEATYIQMAPLGESRYKAIVDSYAMRSAREVAS